MNPVPSSRIVASAYAPASVGNVAIGFDIMGFSVDAIGDRATVRRTQEPGVSIAAIRGVVADLPMDAALNTAGRAMHETLSLPFGLQLELDKGIPLASGLGGSAASAVAAVVAANAVLTNPCSSLELLKFAMLGEQVASGSLHVDNIAASLFGGLVLTVGIDHPRVKQIPVPAAIRAVVVHPHMLLSTRRARAILKSSVPMKEFNLAGFISACYTNDLDLLRESFEDVVIEPQRAALIPGFSEVRRSAMSAGALGCSIAGAGPTVFAWCLHGHALAVREAMVVEFSRRELNCDHWTTTVEPNGARVLP